MQRLIDETRLNLLLEQKKDCIGKRVTWDSILSAVSFLLGALLASYSDLCGIPGVVFKTLFLSAGVFFTCKAVWDVWKSVRNSYSYKDLLDDINKLDEIKHNYSIVLIRDSFNDHANRFLLVDDPRWECKLFLYYKHNENNEDFITDHLSRELKIDRSDISLSFRFDRISEKVSGSDGQRKVYSHKFYVTEVQNFPDFMKLDTFECDGKIYHWMSIGDLEKDPRAMEKNSDIIAFVKQGI